MSFPLVSIVIPCYNQGHFLPDSLASVQYLDPALAEVIIVNDGSTNEATVSLLNRLKEEGQHVIFQENGGLGHARNVGIAASKGKYILPLDADNKIKEGYVEKALEILELDNSVGVVYSDCYLFGAQQGIHVQGPFNLQRLMLGNFIDACAVIRKDVLQQLGGYDRMEIMGYEDWDLWLRIAFAGHRFFFLPEPLFEYRVVQNSMMRNLNADIGNQNKIEAYFLEKFKDYLSPALVLNHTIYQIKKNPVRFFSRFVHQKLSPKSFQKKIDSGKTYAGNFTYKQ